MLIARERAAHLFSYGNYITPVASSVNPHEGKFFPWFMETFATSAAGCAHPTHRRDRSCLDPGPSRSRNTSRRRPAAVKRMAPASLPEPRSRGFSSFCSLGLETPALLIAFVGANGVPCGKTSREAREQNRGERRQPLRWPRPAECGACPPSSRAPRTPPSPFPHPGGNSSVGGKDGERATRRAQLIRVKAPVWWPH